MIGILIGAASFFVVFWVDVFSLKGIRSLRTVFWLTGTALFVCGLLVCVNDPARISLPAPLPALGWLLCVVFVFLLVCSLFIEIPFYGQPSKVVSRGTYALCRHPGVLWLAGFLGALFLARGSPWLLLAMPVWIGLDAIYIVLQEKFFFARMFGAEYEAYQRAVPMLIPTRRSVRECAQTMFRR